MRIAFVIGSDVPQYYSTVSLKRCQQTEEARIGHVECVDNVLATCFAQHLIKG